MISNKQTIALSAVAVGAAIVLFASAPLVAMHQAYAQWWGGWGGGCGCCCGFPGWGMGGFGGPFMGAGVGFHHHHGFHVHGFHVHGLHVHGLHVHHVGGGGGGY